MSTADLFTRSRLLINNHPDKNTCLIKLQQVSKTYQNAAGGYQALNGIDLEINPGEFVGVIGKSGSGKSTLINMVTGIDRPTEGEVWVNGTPIHRLSENQLARWRGKNLGIVFQFFQLLPNLTVLENVILPMDFCSAIPIHERRNRAIYLLKMVGMDDHANKLPAALSGGQQQRVAIARSLANDPPLIVADEPTGNLDSKTAEAMFELFEQLAAEGKTVVMVTHDSSLARKVSRTVLIVDGEVVNEYIARALPSLSPSLMLEASRKAQPVHFAPGEMIIPCNQKSNFFYIITQGAVDVHLKRRGGSDVLVDRKQACNYFGEMGLFSGSRTMATVRAVPEAPVEALVLDQKVFQSLLDGSEAFRETIQNVVQTRQTQNHLILEGQD